MWLLKDICQDHQSPMCVQIQQLSTSSQSYLSMFINSSKDPFHSYPSPLLGIIFSGLQPKLLFPFSPLSQVSRRLG